MVMDRKRGCNRCASIINLIVATVMMLMFMFVLMLVIMLVIMLVMLLDVVHMPGDRNALALDHRTASLHRLIGRLIRHPVADDGPGCRADRSRYGFPAAASNLITDDAAGNAADNRAGDIR